MKNLDLQARGIEVMSEQEMKAENGGGFLDWVGGIIVDVFVDCAIETHERGTLSGMNQVDVKLWN